MELMNNIYVVSLTHWDREWRFPFEKTRMLLVEMMDGLLDLLDRDPEYPCFHLDGQTILLEDYCEVRPQNADRIRKFVQAGRLKIGPWLVLPEENQMSGESLVRNFLWGERLGRKYGGTMKEGYTPTSWGQVSQMPQIFRGFGIDSIIFYRGISADQAPGHYYIWQGPDGSKLLGVRLGDFARVAFFHYVDRPVVFNRKLGAEYHSWEQGGKPFRLCGSGSSAPYEFYQPPMGWHPQNIAQAFEELEHKDLGQWETPFALAMECDDSTGPFMLTPRIVKEAARLVTNGKQIRYGDLSEFMAMAREHLDLDKLTVLTGEMRHPQRAGVFTDIYAEVQACRIPTKYANHRAEFALQHTAEPLATLAWLLGEDYPQFALDRANYMLLQNHAHDSIGGCGRDEVDDDVQFRFKTVQTLCSTITEKAARQIAGRIGTAQAQPEDILLIVFNTQPRPQSCVVRAEIDIAKDRNVRGFTVHGLDGRELPAQIIGRSDFLAVFNHPQEVPCRIKSDRWDFYFHAPDVPAMGYKVFKVTPAKGELRHTGTLRTGSASMANEFLNIHVNPNGSVDVISRETGATLRNQNSFDDRGEVGDYWVGAFPMRDRIVSSLGGSATLSVIEDGPLSCAIQVDLIMDLPVRATQDIAQRERETRPVAIRTVYRLVRGERILRIRTTIANTVEDHLLRALFPTGVATDTAWAQTPFDVVPRAIPLPDTRNWREPYRPVQPHLNFVDLSDGKAGIAILNAGLPQYEAIDDPQRTVALTLLRAHRAWNSVRLAHFPDQSGTQLQGTHTFEYAILPHQGDWVQGCVQQEAQQFNVPPLVGAAGAGEGNLPTSKSFIEVHGAGLAVDAVKKGEWDDSLIIRLSNSTAADVAGEVVLGLEAAAGKTVRVEAVNLMETEVRQSLQCLNGRIAVSVKAKEILTLRLQFA